MPCFMVTMKSTELCTLRTGLACWVECNELAVLRVPWIPPFTISPVARSASSTEGLM